LFLAEIFKRMSSHKEALMATAPAKGRMSAAEAARSDALSQILAESWWAVGLRGVLGIIFGLICLVDTDVAILSIVLVFSAYMLVDGVLAIISAFKAARNGERWGLLILEGLVDIAAGVVAFLWPGLTAITFALIIAIWAIVSGVLMLMSAFTLHIDHGRWWLALGGLASIVFGALVLMAPVVGAVVLTWWIGAYALVFGVFLLILAFQLHHRLGTKKASAKK
jgi:uncharacterized membrane protein HdeD (DUF308 family)